MALIYRFWAIIILEMEIFLVFAIKIVLVCLKNWTELSIPRTQWAPWCRGIILNLTLHPSPKLILCLQLVASMSTQTINEFLTRFRQKMHLII